MFTLEYRLLVSNIYNLFLIVNQKGVLLWLEIKNKTKNLNFYSFFKENPTSSDQRLSGLDQIRPRIVVEQQDNLWPRRRGYKRNDNNNNSNNNIRQQVREFIERHAERCGSWRAPWRRHNDALEHNQQSNDDG